MPLYAKEKLLLRYKISYDKNNLTFKWFIWREIRFHEHVCFMSFAHLVRNRDFSNNLEDFLQWRINTIEL